MNLFEKVTGSDMTAAFGAFDARAQKLPHEYQVAWGQMKTNMWAYADFTGRNLVPLLDGALGLLEESSMENQPIGEVLGDDIEGFCAALAGDDGAKTLRGRWRQQLNRNVAKKLENMGERK